MRYLISFLLLLMPGCLWAQDTQDRGILEAFIEDNLSSADAQVDISGFRGALSSKAELDRLTIADSEGIWLTLEEVTLSWSRSALLSGRLQVDALTARLIEVARKPITKANPSQTEASPFALPELPVSVEIGSVSAENVSIGPDVLGQEAMFEIQGELSLAEGNGAVALAIIRLDKKGAFDLDASFSNETRVLDIDISLTEDPAGIVSELLSLPGAPALELTLAGTGPLSDFAADLAIATDGTERLTGRVVLGTDDTNASVFNADLSGDMAALVAPELQPFFGPQIAFIASGRRLSDSSVQLDQLSLSAAAMQLNGALQLDSGGMPRRFDLTGNIGSGGAPVVLPVSAPRTTITAATINATYDASAGQEWQAEIRMSDLVRSDFQLKQALFSGNGHIQHTGVRGIDADMTLQLEGFAHSDPKIAAAAGSALMGTAKLIWQDDQPVTLSDLDLTAEGVRLSGGGSLATHRAGLPYTWQSSLSASDLSRFAPILGYPISGTAKLAGQGKGTALSGAFDATLDGTTEGLQIGQSLIDPLIAGTGRLELRAVRGLFGMVIPELRIQTDEADIEATASLNGSVGGAVVSANIRDLSKVDRNLSGPASLGTTVTWQDETRATLHRLTFDASGTRLEGTANVDLSSPARPATAELTASAEDLSVWQGVVGQPLGGSFNVSASGAAQLAGAQDATLEFSGQGTDLRSGVSTVDSILAGRSTISALIHRKSGNIEIESLDLNNPQIAANVSTQSLEEVAFELSLTDMSLLVPELPGLLSASGTAQRSGDSWQIDTTLNGPANTTARLSGDIAGDGSTLNVSATGTAPLSLANPFITPNAITGNTEFSLNVNGAPSIEALSGQVVLSDGRLSVPSAPIGLTAISGRVNIQDGSAALNLTSNATGGGRVRVRGDMGLVPGYVAALRVILNDVELTDGEIVETSVDGEIEVTGPVTSNGLVSGQLSLGATEIRIPSGGFGQTGYVPEIVHLNTPVQVQQTRIKAGLVAESDSGSESSGSALGLDLEIDATNQIFVRGRGLDAELGGRLLLGGTTSDVVPAGRFELIRGRLDILGKRLTLNEGAIWLQGELDPSLRLVASTDSDDVTLQIVVEGSASEPEIQFLSQPELPEDEVLARLLFGRDSSSLSPLQAARLASAAANLAGGGSGVADKIRQNLNLDDLDVETDDEGSAQLRAGKYISDNAYTDVTVNGQGESEVNLNLDLTPNVTIKGSLGADGDSGIGLFFERDY